jgi:hypothetical protein
MCAAKKNCATGDALRSSCLALRSCGWFLFSVFSPADLAAVPGAVVLNWW